jgi:hypothetical protein
MAKTATPPAAAPRTAAASKTRRADPKPEPTLPVAATPAVAGDPPEQPKVEDKKPEDPPAGDQGGRKDPPADDPVIDHPEPNENDAEFVLRIFGVPPANYMRDGALDRAALQNDLNTRRHLFANRVLHRRSGA